VKGYNLPCHFIFTLPYFGNENQCKKYWCRGKGFEPMITGENMGFLMEDLKL
jgi:hypothetical protein